MATHSSVLAWRIPGTGSLVGCHLWGRTESDMTEATYQQQSTQTPPHLVVPTHVLNDENVHRASPIESLPNLLFGGN